MKELSNIKVIGCGGCARSGKDTFVSIATNILTRNGYYPFRVAFADNLKQELESVLIANNFKVSVYTNDTDIKTIVRPLMVWWGCQRRVESMDNMYWIKLAEKNIETIYDSVLYDNVDINKVVVLISDVRFSNEVSWIREMFNGEVIHIKKYKIVSDNNIFKKQYDKYPNDEEKLNDPIICDMANQKIEWEQSQQSDAIFDKNLNDIVLKTLNNTKYFKHISNGILT